MFIPFVIRMLGKQDIKCSCGDSLIVGDIREGVSEQPLGSSAPIAERIGGIRKVISLRRKTGA